MVGEFGRRKGCSLVHNPAVTTAFVALLAVEILIFFVLPWAGAMFGMGAKVILGSLGRMAQASPLLVTFAVCITGYYLGMLLLLKIADLGGVQPGWRFIAVLVTRRIAMGVMMRKEMAYEPGYSPVAEAVSSIGDCIGLALAFATLSS